MAKRKPRKKPPASQPAPPRQIGRPSVLEDGNIAQFLGELEVGTPFIAAALVAGFKRGTIYQLIKLGKKHEKEGRNSKQREFLDKFRVARAKGESHYVHLVAQGAAGDAGAPSVQKCPECGADIELEVPRQPRAPDTDDAKFMLKAINPNRWNPERGAKGAEKPISRLELIGAFQQMGQAVKQEVEDPKALLRIGERWREIYRTLGLDENRVQINHNGSTNPDQRKLSNGQQAP